MSITKCMVYDLGTPSLCADDRIDDLIRIVIEVCEANPEFLAPVESKRHAFFLRALSGFNPPDLAIYRLGRKTVAPMPTAGNLPIKALPGLLEHFVLSYFDKSQLLPHYALDTSEFLLAISHGLYRWEPYPWRVEPIIPKDPPFGDFERGFKSAFTRRCYGSILVGTVAEGCNVIGDRYDLVRGRRKDTVEIPSNTQFALRIKRCHLSDPWGDYPSRMTIEPKLKVVALGDEFRFIGNIRSLHDESNHMNQGCDWDNWGYSEVPHEWITHEVQVHGGNNWTLVPLPTWETPIEAPPHPPTVAHSSRATHVTNPIQGPSKKKVGAYPVPPAPICSVCGAELSPAMLVWKPEERFCTQCKRSRKANS